MKKLFISCPMSGRTDEAIRETRGKMHKIAEIIFGEELEVLPSFVPMTDEEKQVGNIAIKKLAQSIDMMADADFFIGCNSAWDYLGCEIETNIARRYGIRGAWVDIQDVAPDTVEKVLLCRPVNAGEWGQYENKSEG